MNILNLLNTKNDSPSKGSNAPLMFFAGSLLGGLGAYLLTEKGIVSRRRLTEKIGQMSSNVKERIALLKGRTTGRQQDDSAEQLNGIDIAADDSAPSAKAQNMVNHMKHNKKSSITDLQ